ncbi:MAG: HNH endonuclease [Proteobacteria bacterium]|nr:HNH endonuclease [Pseudomonadota bacterium]
MRFWWVNQNQTYKHEVAGGYLWSPKRNRDNGRNPFYEFMREVSPGDVVFSFSDTYIKAIGIAASHAYESPKPLEFGLAGAYWDKIGWRVDVRFMELHGPVRPADNMHLLAPLLPEKYAPLLTSGKGLQAVYLTSLPDRFAEELVDLVGREARLIIDARRVADRSELAPAIGLVEWENHEIEAVLKDNKLTETTRQAVVMARRGQGIFKQNVQHFERECRVTKVDQLEHLRASHCRPWRDSSNEDRLNGENGLLLTPNVDHLFDRGFISFEDEGKVLISPVTHRESLRKMGLEEALNSNVGRFTEGQRKFLDFHRESVFLAARFRR